MSLVNKKKRFFLQDVKTVDLVKNNDTVLFFVILLFFICRIGCTSFITLAIAAVARLTRSRQVTFLPGLSRNVIRNSRI